MGLVVREKLQEGMVVDKDVLNSQGQLLIPQATEIKERHIFILETWGVDEISVLGGGEDEIQESFPEEILEQATLEVEEHSIHVNSQHNAVKTLNEIFIINRARKIVAGDTYNPLSASNDIE